jgi:uncharacterized coiled-coil protein SlyX
MDATLVIAAAGVIVPVVGGLVGWLWNAHSKRIDALEQRNAEQDAAMKSIADKHAAFELQVTKDFITQPALMQVMSALDRTITALSDVIKDNQRETRAQLNALNERIDVLFSEKTKG